MKKWFDKINIYMISYKLHKIKRKYLNKILILFGKIGLSILTLFCAIVIPIYVAQVLDKEKLENITYSITSILVIVNFYDFLKKT